MPTIGSPCKETAWGTHFLLFTRISCIRFGAQRERRTVLLERLRGIDLGDPKDGDLGGAVAQSTVSPLLRHAVTRQGNVLIWERSTSLRVTLCEPFPLFFSLLGFSVHGFSIICMAWKNEQGGCVCNSKPGRHRDAQADWLPSRHTSQAFFSTGERAVDGVGAWSRKMHRDCLASPTRNRYAIVTVHVASLGTTTPVM